MRRIAAWGRVVAVVAASCCAVRANAQTSMPLPQLQAMYVYSFIKFAGWPDAAFESPSAPIVIGVVRDQPLVQALQEVTRGKSAHSRPVEVRNVALTGSLPLVHVLVAGQLERTDLADVIRRVNGRPVLTISLDEQFVPLGGVIGLRMIDGRLRFEVNLQAAGQQQLKVTQLVPLAVAVRGARK
jgi:hypothetical protein